MPSSARAGRNAVHTADRQVVRWYESSHPTGPEIPAGVFLQPRGSGIDDIAVKGAGTDQLAVAPGWIVQTDMPGPEGNCAISGHRVTHGHPFRNLDRAGIGDTIYLYSPYRRYRYVIDRILRVTPDHTEVIAYTKVSHLTFTTCDPPGRAVKRLVVQARLVEVVRLRGPAVGTVPGS